MGFTTGKKQLFSRKRLIFERHIKNHKLIQNLGGGYQISVKNKFSGNMALICQMQLRWIQITVLNDFFVHYLRSNYCSVCWYSTRSEGLTQKRREWENRKHKNGKHDHYQAKIQRGKNGGRLEKNFLKRMQTEINTRNVRADVLFRERELPLKIDSQWFQIL